MTLKLLRVLLLPVIVPVFLVGWVLCWFGGRKQSFSRTHTEGDPLRVKKLDRKAEWRMELELRRGEKGNPCTPRRKHT